MEITLKDSDLIYQKQKCDGLFQITDFDSVEEYYNDLKLVLELIEDLNLNTRI